MQNKNQEGSRKIYILLLWEITGSATLGILLFLFNVKREDFIIVPFLAIPVAILIEYIAHLLFHPIRKISIKYNLKSVKDDAKKNDEILLTLNIIRSFILLSLITLIISPWIYSDYQIFIYIISPTILVLLMFNYIRHEKYFRDSIYLKK